MTKNVTKGDKKNSTFYQAFSRFSHKPRRSRHLRVRIIYFQYSRGKIPNKFVAIKKNEKKKTECM